MLDQFIAEYEEQITNRAVALSRARDPLLHEHPTKAAIAVFLTQVVSALRCGSIGVDQVFQGSAAGQGASMLRGGHPIVDVVQTYGDVCQAVTALAAEMRRPISAGDFCAFNRCLDDAIGHAVSE